jgi:hypothetical protein
MKTAIEIYKLLPKTNCGKCGTTSCMGFAAKLSTSQASLDDCKSMAPRAREILKAALSASHKSRGTAFEQTLQALLPRVSALDFAKTASLFGAALIDHDTLEIAFLNAEYRITRDRILDSRGREPRPWVSILIYNHLCSTEPPLPAGEWITFSSIPASHAKDKAWAVHVEEEIARHFSGNGKEFNKACERLGGAPATAPGNHDAAYEFRFFPHFPVLLLFDDVVAAENFPAQCRMLLDKTAPQYLDIESIVVLGEEFAGRLTTENAGSS